MFAALERGELHPRDLKMRLAFEIVDIFKGRTAAEAAQDHFRTVFQQRDLPSDMPGFAAFADHPGDLLTAQQLAPSKSEARRFVAQGGVVDGERGGLQPDPAAGTPGAAGWPPVVPEVAGSIGPSRNERG